MHGLVGQAVTAAAMGLWTTASADAPAYDDFQALDHAAAFFKVPLHSNQDPQTIRLDVNNTDTPCDPTTLSINNQPLPLGAHHLGLGSLDLASGSTIEAFWTITCVTQDQDGQLEFNPGNISPVKDEQFAQMKPGMWVVVDVLKVDGEHVHVGLEANFVQGGDYVRWHFTNVYGLEREHGDVVEVVTHFGGEVDWVVPWDVDAVREAEQELEWLRTGEWVGEDGEDDLEDVFENNPSLEELQSLEHSAAYFSIDLGYEDVEERHILRLDVLDSDQRCDPFNKIFVFDTSLHDQRARDLYKATAAYASTLDSRVINGNTVSGEINLPSGPRLGASWVISCVDPSRDDSLDTIYQEILPEKAKYFKPGVFVSLDIHTVDGVDVTHKHLGFSVNFAQGETWLQWHSAGFDFPDTKTLLFNKAPLEIDQDGTLEWHEEALDGMTDEQFDAWYTPIPRKTSATTEEEATPMPNEEAEVAESPQPVQEKCTDIECLMGQLRGGMTIEEFSKIDTMAKIMVEEALTKQGWKQKPLKMQATEFGNDDETVTIMDDSAQMKPITAVDAPSSVSSDTPTSTPTGLFLTALPPQDQDLLLTLFLAGTAFLLFTLVSLSIFKSRPEPSVQRLPLHRETREERLARVANRRRAAKSFFSKLFCGLFSFDEKTLETPQGRDCRQEEGTMEQEIVQFREVANMVESMIAAEEGRNQQVQRPEMSNEEAAPPSYETDRAEAGMVADGFRYTRVQGEAEVRRESVNEGSDRLGYGNKD